MLGRSSTRGGWSRPWPAAASVERLSAVHAFCMAGADSVQSLARYGQRAPSRAAAHLAAASPEPHLFAAVLTVWRRSDLVLWAGHLWTVAELSPDMSAALVRPSGRCCHLV